MIVGTQSTLNDLEALKAVDTALDGRIAATETDVEDIKNGATAAGPYKFGIASRYGSGGGETYIHIKTRFKPYVNDVRFHIRYVGLQYNNGKTFQGMFTGYCYAGGFTSGGASGDFLTDVPSVYITSDGFIAMRLRLDSDLESSLHIDSIATKGFSPISGADIEIMASVEESI